MNRNDSYKTILKVKNRAWTPFLYRGQTFPVIIMTEGSSTVSGDSKYSAVGGSDSSLNPPGDKRAPNLFLCGNYVVLGFNLEFTPEEGIYQSMLLGKKQWTMNPGVASDPTTLDPMVSDADFNDLIENASTILHQEVGKIKEDIFSK